MTQPNRFGILTERRTNVIFWIAIYLGVIYLFAKDYELANATGLIEVNRIDFVAFWAAAKLFVAGNGMAAFDQDALIAAAGFPADEAGSVLWHYPPAMMILVGPLGLLPFWAAWTVFAIASLVGFWLALRGPTAALPGGWRIFAAAPVVLVGCLAIGQTSVLWTAGLVAALWAMGQGRSVQAGFWIALLTLKPQLGLLIPFALIAAGQWRVILWATVFSVAIAVVSTLPFGLAYWEAFATEIQGRVQLMSEGFILPPFVSVYGFFRINGAAHETAIVVQAVVTLAMLAAILWVWSRPHIRYDLKCAALCAAIPLASPYAYYYEMVLTLAAGMYLMRDGFGRRWLSGLWLLVIWFGPVFPLYLPDYMTIASTAPVMLLVTMTICLVRATAAGVPRQPA
ncbi:MAG: DUF2029 domain-containing protein [Paracoccaceae bacterium]|nr:DUF2029 domain-containing protein [Paracoccaceae bacterium]